MKLNLTVVRVLFAILVETFSISRKIQPLRDLAAMHYFSMNAKMRSCGHQSWRTYSTEKSHKDQKVTSISYNVAGGDSANDPLLEFNLPRPLILGSSSFTRKFILKEMGVSYQVFTRPINEKAIGSRSSGNDASILVMELAMAKAAHIAEVIGKGEVDDLSPSNCSNSGEESREKIIDLIKREHGLIILTADQVVTHGDEILEKPRSIEEARDFVSRYGVTPPRTVGACVLTHLPTMKQVSGVDSATIRFLPSVAQSGIVDKLLEDGEPVLSCAGGLMVEHPLVKKHIAGIDGAEDSVMGLSKSLVMDLFAQMKRELM